MIFQISIERTYLLLVAPFLAFLVLRLFFVLRVFRFPPLKTVRIGLYTPVQSSSNPVFILFFFTFICGVWSLCDPCESPCGSYSCVFYAYHPSEGLRWASQCPQGMTTKPDSSVALPFLLKTAKNEQVPLEVQVPLNLLRLSLD